MKMQRLALVGALLGSLIACGGGNDKPQGDGGTDATTTTPVTQDELAEACVRMHACGIQRHPRLGDCINDYNERLQRLGQGALYSNLYRCALAGAGDCGVIRQCLGFERKPKSCDQKHVARCDGNVAVNCDLLAKWEQGIDCAKGGLKCAVKDTGSSRAAVCGGGTCDATSQGSECRQSRLFDCVGGVYEIIDCPAMGLQCRDAAFGDCEGRGRSCLAFAPECKGAVLSRCTNGYVEDLDCKKLGQNLRCDATLARCVAAGTECSTDSFFNSCEGDELVVCIDGMKKRYDCKKLGFLGCEAAAAGAACKAAQVYN